MSDGRRTTQVVLPRRKRERSGKRARGRRAAPERRLEAVVAQ